MKTQTQCLTGLIGLFAIFAVSVPLASADVFKDCDIRFKPVQCNSPLAVYQIDDQCYIVYLCDEIIQGVEEDDGSNELAADKRAAGFLRIGKRASGFMRIGKRDSADKRASGFLRIGRNMNPQPIPLGYMRRSRASGFLRIGRR